MSTSLWQLSAAEQASGIQRGDFTSEQLTQAVLNRIEVIDPVLNAFCTLNERSLDDARDADHRRAGGDELGPLHGVPFSVKDLLPTAGVRTSLGSQAHSSWVPSENEAAVSRILAAGGILIGKTNTRELGYGVVTDNVLFGSTRNPANPEMTAAGSSGGAAAAVASGMGSIALGSDGGGSLRVPAAVCGVFAHKPTYGVVPTYPSSRIPIRVGLNSWESLECVGPITRNVHDSALVLKTIAGFDPRDSHSIPVDSSTQFSYKDTRQLTVAFSPDLGIAEVNPYIAETVETACKAVAAQHGWELRVVSPILPSLKELRKVFAATVVLDTDVAELREMAALTEVSIDIRELVDREWSVDELTRARANRQLIFDILRRFHEQYDVLITPATATTAFPLGERFPSDGEYGIKNGEDWSPFAFLANLTGQPACSVPVGSTPCGLPIGAQVLGPRFADGIVLSVARSMETYFPPSDNFRL